MALKFAYNTNGLQSHRLDDALSLIADSGYHGVALTLDHMHLDPLRASADRIRQVKSWLHERHLEVVIETGARFVLDPYQKHRPGLCHPEKFARQKRLNLLKRSIEIASELGSDLLNFAAGPRDEGRDESEAWSLLVEGIGALFPYAKRMGVRLSFEPEPDHWIQTLEGYHFLRSHLPDLLLTLDVSHVSVCCDEGTQEEAIAAHFPYLGLMHIEDAPRGVHSHLPFGEGELDIPSILAVLDERGFNGLCAVELSRHSHAAHQMVPKSLKSLQLSEQKAQMLNSRKHSHTG